MVKLKIKRGKKAISLSFIYIQRVHKRKKIYVRINVKVLYYGGENAVKFCATMLKDIRGSPFTCVLKYNSKASRIIFTRSLHGLITANKSSPKYLTNYFER